MVRETIEVRILSLYAQGKLFDSYSISEIARTIGAGYPHVHTAITQMQKQGILKTQQFGRTIFCTPNLANDYARNLLAQASIKQKNEQLNNTTITQINKEITTLCTNNPTIIAAILTQEQTLLITREQTNIQTTTPTTTISLQELRMLVQENQAFLNQAIILHGQENIYFYLQDMKQTIEVVQ